MYRAFGVKESTYLRGVSEWAFGALLLARFRNKKLGVLGALGSIVTFITTVTISPLMPDGKRIYNFSKIDANPRGQLGLKGYHFVYRIREEMDLIALDRQFRSGTRGSNVRKAFP
jgi:uncharacterized membrane protein YkgB